MNPTQIARVVHEANRAVQVEQDDPTIPVSPHWDDLDDETKASAVDGVEGVIQGNTPEQSHENWVRFKVTNGWTLGPVKDEATKQHPLLIPYAELPESQKVKDHLFVAVVRALWDGDDLDVDGERAKRQVEFLEMLADGGDLTVNGIPWREAFERLNAIVSDSLPPASTEPDE